VSHPARTGGEQDERAVSGAIYAALALTTKKKREAVSGRRKRSEAMYARGAHLHSVNLPRYGKITT